VPIKICFVVPCSIKVFSIYSTMNFDMLSRFYIVVCLSIGLVIPAYADTAVAVLEFELKDLTLSPRVQEERERAASIKPMLEKVLRAKGGYELISIDSDSQQDANQATGYLFDHHDLVASLGQQFGAEFVVLGRVHKASHLFVYFLVHLVDVKSKQLVGDYVVEVKGPQKKLTIKGVESLVEKIHKTLKPPQ